VTRTKRAAAECKIPKSNRAPKLEAPESHAYAKTRCRYKMTCDEQTNQCECVVRPLRSVSCQIRVDAQKIIERNLLIRWQENIECFGAQSPRKGDRWGGLCTVSGKDRYMSNEFCYWPDRNSSTW